MRNFILGAVAALLLLLLGGLAIATLGLLPTNADSNPPRIERRIANAAWTPPWIATRHGSAILFLPPAKI